MKKIEIIKKCGYCEKEVKEVANTPFIADIPNFMCRECWNSTKEGHGKHEMQNFEDVKIK